MLKQTHGPGWLARFFIRLAAAFETKDDAGPGRTWRVPPI
jgi:hypothetical protein